MKLKRAWLEHLGVLSAYSALALALSYPLLLHFGDTITGVPGDVWSYLWAMGWARAALDLGINPFHTDYVFYPLGGATQLLWATALPSFFSLPLQAAFGLVPTFNLLYLASTVLTAYGMYLLARDVLTTDNPPLSPLANGGARGVFAAAFFAGLAFAFCALRLGYGLAFTNLYHTELIPFYILSLLKTRRESSRRNAIVAGILFGLNVYIDFQIAAFLVLFSTLWFLALLVTLRAKPRIELARRVSRIGVIAIVAGIVALPMIAVVAQDLSGEGGDYVRVYPLSYSAARSYDLLAYFLPNAQSSFYQQLAIPRIAAVNAALTVEGESQLSPDRQSFLGITLLALALYASIRRRRRNLFWIGAAIFFALLSFGPTLHIAGTDSGIPLPYALLHEVPLANHIRIPMRYGLLTFFSVSILAAVGMQELAARWNRVAVAALFSTLMLAETAVLPYPTLAARIPPVYPAIAAQPGDFSVLEIPTFNWRAAAASEVFQAIHHKRLLRIYTNRVAPELADYFSFRSTPIIVRSLRMLEGAEEGTLSDEQRVQDRAAAPTVIDFFHLRYAVLHREWLDDDHAARLDLYLRDVLGARTFFNEGSVTAYEFPTPALTASHLEINASSALAPMYLGRGWRCDPPINAEGERGCALEGAASELFLGALDLRDHTLRLRAFAERAGATIRFEFNRRAVGAISLHEGWADYSIDLPQDAIQNPMNRSRLLPSFGQRLELSRIEIR